MTKDKMNQKNFSSKIKEHSLGVTYVFAIVVLGAIINYFTWAKDEEMTNELLFLLILGIALFYLPLIFFTHYTDWKIREFGFVLNGTTLVISTLLIFLSLFVSSAWLAVDFRSSVIEVIALVGEEVLFRGFVYVLILRLFENKEDMISRLWAIFLSSLAFALAHTQTFLPDNNDTMLQIFLFALFITFIRSWSGSILPGIILHILFNTGEFASVIFGCMIYGLFVFWSHRKDEERLYLYSH